MSDVITFWEGIAKLPEQAQKSFWDAGIALSQFIGEPPQPRHLKLEYDFSKPPAGAAWWERLLFYAGQGQYNQAVANAQTGQAVVDGSKWLWGALQGDFNKNPTTGQVITGGIISMIPFVDQACDVRDVIANCLNLSHEAARKDPENWIALGLTCIGFVPEFGSAVKTVGKVAIKDGTRLLGLLKNMEWIEKHFKALKAGCPWGYAPIEWLRKYDWIGAAKRAATDAKKAFEKALHATQTALSFAVGAVKAKLQELVALFKAIVARIGTAIADACKRIKAKIDDMLGGARKEAGNYDATPGKSGNKHAQGDAKPPRGGGKPPKMDPHKPKCFKPGDELRKNWKGDPNKLEKEFYEQLKAQEAGLNKLTVGEYLENRARFEQVQRAGSGAAQAAARADLTQTIRESVFTSARNRGMGPKAAAEYASSQTKDIMSGLAALHEPDMIAGGKDEVLKISDRKVNSSIGSQWKGDGRIAGMDNAAQDALKAQGPDAKMSVTLERCK